MAGAGQKHFKALERSSDVHPESGRRRDREHSALRLSLAAALAECGMCRPPVAGVRRRGERHESRPMARWHVHV